MRGWPEAVPGDAWAGWAAVVSARVVEANVTERTPHRPVVEIPFEFPFRDAPVRTQIKGYDIHEMLGTKLRALFQRRRGRDLFDLYWALTQAKPPVVPATIIESFQHYLRLERSVAGRTEFVTILDAQALDTFVPSEAVLLSRIQNTQAVPTGYGHGRVAAIDGVHRHDSQFRRPLLSVRRRPSRRANPGPRRSRHGPSQCR